MQNWVWERDYEGSMCIIVLKWVFSMRDSDNLKLLILTGIASMSDQSAPPPSEVRKVFRRQYSELAQAIQQPESLAADLYSKGLISKATQVDIMTNKGYSTEQKAAQLVNEIEAGLETSNKPHEHLRKFCTIIKRYPALKPLADRMKTAVGEWH